MLDGLRPKKNEQVDEMLDGLVPKKMLNGLKQKKVVENRIFNTIESIVGFLTLG